MDQKDEHLTFTALVNKYKDSIHFYILKIVNNPTDAEDLTSETFEKAYANRHTYSPDYAFSTWLFKIATNTCIDFIRRKQSNPVSVEKLQEESNFYLSSIQTDDNNPEETYISNQNITTLRELINQLKPAYKSLIELRYYKEYSYEEIAKELNLPIGTVKVQLYRAKLALSNLLKNKQ